jgi:pyruvate-ferredoxin/flavodoxin oxidoreductase
MWRRFPGREFRPTLKAIQEAESYDGPSLIIGYAPCINHGIKAGMGKSMLEMRNAVHSGYWNLLRYDPRWPAEGKKALTVDSRYPAWTNNEFIMGEVRYNSLTLTFPDRAQDLFAHAEEDAESRFDRLLEQRDEEDDQGIQG